MYYLPKLIFFAVIVRPLVHLLLGLEVFHRKKLPVEGPAIIVANHNSHLDTFVLMSLLPLRLLSRVRPVANANYFLRNRWLAWFSIHIFGILPVSNGNGLGKHHVLNEVINALKEGNIIILYPEGTRGRPEQLEEFKRGIAVLTTALPGIPVHPVFIRGLGKSLPKGEYLFVPFLCSVLVGRPVRHVFMNGSKMMEWLKKEMHRLSLKSRAPEWN